MQKIYAVFQAIRVHPLARKHRMKACANVVMWQIQSRLSKRARKVPYTEKTFLMVTKGMTGATGNIYMGLHEFADMSFILHFLRPEDLFFDIGANVGSYTILSSGHVGARSVAVEPIRTTFEHLLKNTEANNIQGQVKALNMGVGASNGKLFFTTSYDTINHVQSANELGSAGLEVDVTTVDDLTISHGVPLCIKIDVEGYETEVVKGMHDTLMNPDLKVIIIELNGSGRRYGFDEKCIHDTLMNHGFRPVSYEPFERKISNLISYGSLNTIYLRDIDFVRNRIACGEPIKLFSESF